MERKSVSESESRESKEKIEHHLQQQRKRGYCYCLGLEAISFINKSGEEGLIIFQSNFIISVMIDNIAF